MDRIGWLVSHWALAQNDELAFVPVWETRRTSMDLAQWLVESIRGGPLPPDVNFVEGVMRPLCEAAAAECRRQWTDRNGFYPDVPLIVDSMVTPGIESAFPVIFAVDGPLGMDDREELELFASAQWRNVVLFHTRSVKLTLQVLVREGLLAATPVHEFLRGTPDGRLADRD